MLDLTPALLVVLFVLMPVAVWRMGHRLRTSRGRAPLPDVPDAPSTASAIEAPGIDPPYSSLDPTAPPKQPFDVPETRRGRADDT